MASSYTARIYSIEQYPHSETSRIIRAEKPQSSRSNSDSTCPSITTDPLTGTSAFYVFLSLTAAPHISAPHLALRSKFVAEENRPKTTAPDLNGETDIGYGSVNSCELQKYCSCLLRMFPPKSQDIPRENPQHTLTHPHTDRKSDHVGRTVISQQRTNSQRSIGGTTRSNHFPGHGELNFCSNKTISMWSNLINISSRILPFCAWPGPATTQSSQHSTWITVPASMGDSVLANVAMVLPTPEMVPVCFLLMSWGHRPVELGPAKTWIVASPSSPRSLWNSKKWGWKLVNYSCMKYIKISLNREQVQAIAS